MSQRIYLTSTPDRRPELFTRVSHSDVRPGDIYQGKKGRRSSEKWYANTEGQGCVDLDRAYYRPIENHPEAKTATFGPILPKKHKAAEAAAPGGTKTGTWMQQPRVGQQPSATAQPCSASGAMEEEDAVPTKTGSSIEGTEDHGNGFTTVLLRVVIDSDKIKDALMEAVEDALSND